MSHSHFDRNKNSKGMKSHIFPVTSNGMVILGFTGVLATASFAAVGPDTRYVIAPVIATLVIAILFWWMLSNRRGEVPIADPGSLTVLAIVFYTIIPPLQFFLSGFEHTILSALPLYERAPTPGEFGGFTWWYVVYLLGFTMGYLFTDSKTGLERVYPNPPDLGTVRSFVLLFIVLSVFMFTIELLYGINMYGVYDADRMYDSYDTYLQMPLFFRQFYGIIGHNGILFIVKLGLLLTIFLNWQKKAYRYVLITCLLLILIKNILWMGARTELVLIFLASGIMYHRFVKPLQLKLILASGTILFAGMMTIGVMRGEANLGANLERSRTMFSESEIVFSMNTEFQSLFGGNYDLLKMKQEGALGDVPIQFLLFDLFMIIPQQVLPFEKLDVQKWYVDQSNYSGYFMFNPISQAIIGFGWVELILRGLFLGFLFAKIRAWYIKRSSSFWVTLLYFYLIIISYSTIRSTAIYLLLVSILYRFIPLYFLIRFMPKHIRGAPPLVPSVSRVGKS